MVVICSANTDPATLADWSLGRNQRASLRTEYVDTGAESALLDLPIRRRAASRMPRVESPP